jgi:hypothetical protein
MQYILTEAEYKNLIPAMELMNAFTAIDILQRLYFAKTNTVCVKEDTNTSYQHCDNCPFSGKPEIEGFTKDEMQKIKCTKNKSFSK